MALSISIVHIINPLLQWIHGAYSENTQRFSNEWMIISPNIYIVNFYSLCYLVVKHIYFFNFFVVANLRNELSNFNG